LAGLAIFEDFLTTATAHDQITFFDISKGIVEDGSYNLETKSKLVTWAPINDLNNFDSK